MAALDLVYQVLDLQVVDVDGRRCGRVDDIEIDGDPARAVAILIGHGAYPARLPGVLCRLARRVLGPPVLGGNVTRVPWRDIESIDSAVHLRRSAGDVGLARADRILERGLQRGLH
jgi:sporulation protein YlmC with PRC-barrel domain